MAEYKRLGGGKGRRVDDISELSKLHIHILPNMATALRLAKRPYFKGFSKNDARRLDYVAQRPVSGDPVRLKAAQIASEMLVEDALACDPRLARKSQWFRRDEGEHVCCAALASGDDEPFYKRTRSVVNEATAAGEPMRIVVSTDDKNVPEGTAAAFIAVSRLVQQFVPIEVWWQGSWLNPKRSKGFTFMVPLVQGDMDFSRLEYCIADPSRDSFSYLVMATHAALDLKESWNGCGARAECAYHPTLRSYNGGAYPDYSKTTKFISHRGISANAESVAGVAADWLGWPAIWSVQYQATLDAKAAGQEIPKTDEGYKYTPLDAATKARWAKQDADAKTKALIEANERLVGV